MSTENMKRKIYIGMYKYRICKTDDELDNKGSIFP